MPYCEACSKFWNPNSMPADGRCPSCGVQLAEPVGDDEYDDYSPPWHFKVLVALTVIYLGWRFLQLFGLLK